MTIVKVLDEYGFFLKRLLFTDRKFAHFVVLRPRDQSRDIHYGHVVVRIYIWLLGCEVSINFQSHLLNNRAVTGANKVNLDLSLVFMLVCGLLTKNALYLKTYTTFQLYELPSINREVFFYQNQVSNLFCGDGWTKLSFFGPCSLTTRSSSVPGTRLRLWEWDWYLMNLRTQIKMADNRRSCL